MCDANESYITRIPPEVLSLIFLECSTLVQKSGYIGYCNQRCFPLSLASVSKFWRQVAYVTSELWSTCWLSYTHPELNTLWLSRAGMRTLEIDGSIIPDVRGGSCPINPLLSSIAPFTDRCRSFSIDYTLLSKEDADTCAFYAPNLASCQILKPGAPLWLRQFFFRAPNLQRLQIGSFLPGFGAMFDSLVDLQVGYLSQREELRRILDKATNLRSLSLGYSSTADDGFWFQKRVIHPSLVQLKLYCACVEEIADVLSVLTLPSLNNLSLHSAKDSREMDVFDFRDFLNRSQCAIQELMMDSSDLLPILKHQALGSLEVLKLLDVEIPDSLLALLHDPTNLSRLRKLSIEQARNYSHLDFALLSGAVSARIAVVGPLRAKLEYLKLSFDPSFIYTCSCEVMPNMEHVSRIRAMAKCSQGDVTPFVADIVDPPCGWKEPKPEPPGGGGGCSGYDGVPYWMLAELCRQ